MSCCAHTARPCSLSQQQSSHPHAANSSAAHRRGAAGCNACWMQGMLPASTCGSSHSPLLQRCTLLRCSITQVGSVLFSCPCVQAAPESAAEHWAGTHSCRCLAGKTGYGNPAFHNSKKKKHTTKQKRISRLLKAEVMQGSQCSSHLQHGSTAED